MNITTNKDGFFSTQHFGDEKSTQYLKNLEARSTSKLNLIHPVRLLLNFFGLPVQTRPDDDNAKQLIVNAFLNLIDWHTSHKYKKVANWRRLLDFTMIKPILSLVLNLISMVFKLAKNILKLITELLPALMANLCREGISESHAMVSAKDATPGKKALGYLLGAAAYTGFFIFKSVHVVGRAITSPYNSMMAAYQFGYEKSSTVFENEKLKKAVGVVFLLLSAALTIGIYSVLLPLVLTHLVAPLASKIVTALPAHIGEAIMTAANTITPHLSSIGNILHNAFSSLYTALAVSPIHTGIAIMASAAITTVGNALSHLKVRLQLLWRTKAAVSKQRLKIDIDEGYSEYEDDKNYQNYKAVSDAPGIMDKPLPMPSNPNPKRHAENNYSVKFFSPQAVKDHPPKLVESHTYRPSKS